MLLSLENSFELNQNIFVHFSGLRFLVLHLTIRAKSSSVLFSSYIFKTLHKDSVKTDNCIIKIFTWLLKLFKSTYCLVKIHRKPHVHAVPHKLYTAAGPAKLWYHSYSKTKTTKKRQKCQPQDII